jgi:hypothetical protein
MDSATKYDDDLKPAPQFRRDHNMSSATFYRRLATGEIKAVKRGRLTFVLISSYREYVANLKPFVSRDSSAPELIKVAKRDGTLRPPGTPRPKKATRKTRAKAA